MGSHIVYRHGVHSKFHSIKPTKSMAVQYHAMSSNRAREGDPMAKEHNPLESKDKKARHPRQTHAPLFVIIFYKHPSPIRNVRLTA